MRYKVFFMLFIALGVFAFVYLTHNQTPFFKVSGYDEFHNLYQYDDQVKVMVVKNSDQVSYYLKLSQDASVLIADTLYQGNDIILLDLPASLDKTYVMIHVYDEHDTLRETSRFYFALHEDDLMFLKWSLMNPLGRYVILFLFVLMLQFIYFALLDWSIKHSIKKEKPTDLNQTIDRIKSFSLLEKIVYSILLLVYLVFPQVLIFPLAFVFVIYVVINMKNLKYRLYALLSMIPIFAIGILVFAGFLFITTPESFNNTFKHTSLTLTPQEQRLYERLIDEVDYYKLDPVIMNPYQDFALIGLYGYRTSYWFNRNPIDQPVFYVIPYQLESTEDIDLLVLNHNLVIFRREPIKNHVNKTLEIRIPDSVRSITIEIRNKQNQLLYRSQVIPVKQDRNDYPEPIYYGGQYVEKPLRTWIMNALGVHLGSIAVITMSYALSKRFDHLFIEKNKRARSD